MSNSCMEPTRVAVFQAPGAERDALVQVLEMDAFEVVAVSTQEQVELLLTCPPDVLVVDLSVRSDSVPRLFQQYRKREPHTPFLAVGTMYEDREKCRDVEIGIDRFFVKPIDPALFMMRLRAAAERHRTGKVVLNTDEATRLLAVTTSPGNGKP